MQRLTKKELHGFRSEFEMTCAAQDGNGGAWLILWNQYKNMMMSQLIAVKGLSREELESEAVEVFADKLAKFDRTKVSSENAYSMHSWLWCAVLNKTNALIRSRKKEVHLYFEGVSAACDRDGQCSYSFNNSPDVHYIVDEGEDWISQANQMRGINEEIYNTYNPEKLAIESLHDSDSDRVKAFYAKLSQFEKDILAARREGLTLAEVAKKFSCSVSTIKGCVRKAKMYAEDIFQVCYA